MTVIAYPQTSGLKVMFEDSNFRANTGNLNLSVSNFSQAKRNS